MQVHKIQIYILNISSLIKTLEGLLFQTHLNITHINIIHLQHSYIHIDSDCLRKILSSATILALWAQIDTKCATAVSAGYYSAIRRRNASTSSRMFIEKNLGNSVEDGVRDNGGMCRKAFLGKKKKDTKQPLEFKHYKHQREINWRLSIVIISNIVVFNIGWGSYCVLWRTVLASAGLVSMDAVTKEVTRERYQMAEASDTDTSLLLVRW